MDDVRVRTSTSSDTSSSSTSRREFCAWLCVHACSHAGLAALVVAYTLLGAVLFELVEGGGHAATAPSSRSSSAAVTSSVASGGGDRRGAVTAVQKSREECLRELWTITERLNVLYERNWTRLVHEQLRKFELNVMAATQLGGGPGSLQDLQDTNMGHPQQWSFGGALLYSVTVITTIGYGNLSPRTSLGKILTMIYALFGVPLMLLCLSSLGQALAKGVHYVYMRVTCQQINNTSSHPAGRSEGHSHSSCKRMTAGSSRDRRQDYKYQMVSNSPARSSCASTHDSSVIQIATPHKSLSPPPPPQLTPRKSALATVNSSHTRPRCRLLSTPLPPSAHASDAEDLDETDDTESGMDLVNKKVEVLTYAPLSSISGTYDVDGKLLGLQLADTGTTNVTFVEGTNLYTFTYDLIDKKGKQYIKILTSVLDNKDIKRIYFDMELTRNKVLSDSVKAVLNDNWREVTNEVRESVGLALGEIFKAFLQPFFYKVPFDEFFALE